MIIHQAVYGYARGHRLLESSSPIPSAAESVMAVLTDISGPTTGQDFEAYLSGYPLDVDTYVLARTWYAPEMPRPGTVWTHALLIRVEDLSSLRDADAVVELFRRPSADTLDEYREPIEIDDDVGTRKRQLGSAVDPKDAALVLEALYGSHASQPVRILTDRFAQCEDLVMAIWMQQWPRLRAEFTFCTFALAERTLHSQPFALQVSPYSVIRRGTIGRNEVRLDLDSPGTSEARRSWISAALRDLLSANRDSSLRSFLAEFGEDPSLNGRLDFVGLADVYVWLQGADASSLGANIAAADAEGLLSFDTRKFVDLVGYRFPGEKATRLKNALFGYPQHAQFRWRALSEPEVLTGLAMTSAHSAFDPTILRVADRALQLWKTDSVHARATVDAILRADVTPLGQEFIYGISRGIDGPTLFQLTSQDERAFVSLVRGVPRLLTLPVVWDVSPALQFEIWSVARDLDILLGDTNRNLVIAAMLTAGTNGIAEMVTSHVGARSVNAVMDWVQSQDPSVIVLAPSWKRAIAEHQDELLDWLLSCQNPSTSSFLVLGAILDPEASVVRRVSADDWLRIAAQASNLRPQPLEFLAFLLCIALDDTGDDGASIAATAFEPVHDAARVASLSKRAWAHLERRLPRVRNQWDHCDRMRRGVADRFLDGRWPAAYLLLVARSPRVFRMIVDYALSRRNGRTFIRDLSRVAKEGTVTVSDAQRDILQRYDHESDCC